MANHGYIARRERVCRERQRRIAPVQIECVHFRYKGWQKVGHH